MKQSGLSVVLEGGFKLIVFMKLLWVTIESPGCAHIWGEPERAPHRSVVDVGGTSVACPKIYATYMVVGWWYECRMLDNLHILPTIYAYI